MKTHGCEFCNDLRNIEPAKYIGGGDEEFKKFINEAKEKKQFVFHYKKGDDRMFAVITECPICKCQFTKEDYDSY